MSATRTPAYTVLITMKIPQHAYVQQTMVETTVMNTLVHVIVMTV